MRLLITGNTGFVGPWCAREAASNGRWQLLPTDTRCDVRDPAAIAAALADGPPDAVVHLAAQSFVPASFADPRATLEVNLLGTLNLLQGLARVGFKGRFLYVSSADIYGQVPAAQMPITEDRLAEPRNPYAVSKLAAEALCRQWHFTDGLDLVIARPFNHIGPGQQARFVVAGLARQLALIASNRQPPRITVGNLAVSRDFTDVRDVASAYFKLLEDGEPGATYNICTGHAVRLGDILTELEQISGVSPEIQVDPSRLRPNEQIVAFGSPARLMQMTGWAPRIGLHESLTDIYSYWKQAIHHEQD